MESLEGHGEFLWDPFSVVGINHPLLKINARTIVTTWIVLILLALILSVVRFFIMKKNRVAIYLAKAFINSFKELVAQALGYFHYRHTLFIISLFSFILLCNWISLLPGLEEPTADLNTAFAMGLLSFFYKDIYAIIEHGFFGFMKEFFVPFFLMFPLNLMGHLSKVVSMSFRLFGNIFGGAVITKIYGSALGNSILLQLLGLITGMNFIVMGFFVLFEGFIQAFVFVMLTLTYLGIAIQHEEV